MQQSVNSTLEDLVFLRSIGSLDEVLLGTDELKEIITTKEINDVQLER